MDCCVFVHYGQESELPPADSQYVQELAGLFSKLILVTNERKFQPKGLPPQVEIRMVKNEGYDFGMFYKVVQDLDLKDLDRLVLANDSNVLLGDLGVLMKRGSELKSDFWGVLDSYERPWFSTHRDNFHLQSHFLVWEKGALTLLQTFLRESVSAAIWEEADPKKIRRKIINDWEIGFSQFALQHGLTPRAVFQSQPISAGSGHPLQTNFGMKYPRLLLEEGYPFLKKKYILRPSVWKRFWSKRDRWEVLIRDFSTYPTAVSRIIEYFQNQRKK